MPLSRIPSTEATLDDVACNEDSAFSLVHHAVDLDVQLDPPELRGKGEIYLRAKRASQIVVLDAKDVRIEEAHGQRESLSFRQVGEHLCIRWPELVASGERITIGLSWNVPTQGKVPRFSKDEVWAGYQTSAWMPTLQDPSERATLALRIAAAPKLAVTATGRLLAIRELSDGRKVHAFALERAAPPFLFAFAAGHFGQGSARGEPRPVFRTFTPDGRNPERVMRTTLEIYDYFRGRLGTPLPSDEYTQVFVRGDAAQEGAGLAFIGAEALDDLEKDETDVWVFAHELAHQWFGWLVACADFDDFWLNEGFATFMAATFKEYRFGRAAYDKEVELWRARSAKVHAEKPEAPVSLAVRDRSKKPRIRESDLQPRAITYSRGALVLHRLREELGQPAFWAGLQKYLEERGDRGATTEDLREALEKASGRDLKNFFARWVYANAPDL